MGLLLQFRHLPTYQLEWDPATSKPVDQLTVCKSLVGFDLNLVCVPWYVIATLRPDLDYLNEVLCCFSHLDMNPVHTAHFCTAKCAQNFT